MSETPPTYEIVSVWDFLKVPEDRLEICLREFAVALHTGRHGLALLGILTEEAHGSVDAVTWALGPAFTWVDDDKGEAVLHVSGQVRRAPMSSENEKPPHPIESARKSRSLADFAASLGAALLPWQKKAARQKFEEDERPRAGKESDTPQ